MSEGKGRDTIRFGELLRLWMVTNRFTTRDVSDELGISASTVSRLANGYPPDSETLICLIQYFFRRT